jgi:hypothetical protein
MEETKTCPQCGKKVPEQSAYCINKEFCHYAFLMSCQGCGREVRGRVFCRECIEPGVYHFQRTESAELIRPGEESAKKFVNNALKDLKRNENGSF